MDMAGWIAVALCHVSGCQWLDSSDCLVLRQSFSYSITYLLTCLHGHRHRTSVWRSRSFFLSIIVITDCSSVIHCHRLSELFLSTLLVSGTVTSSLYRPLCEFSAAVWGSPFQPFLSGLSVVAVKWHASSTLRSFFTYLYGLLTYLFTMLLMHRRRHGCPPVVWHDGRGAAGVGGQGKYESFFDECSTATASRRYVAIKQYTHKHTRPFFV